MRIIAFETSAKAASVALLTDGALTGEFFLNCGQTHSVTLLRLARELLAGCGLAPAQLDLAAWANGPGSFTGVRIGAAAAKGLCWGLELPCLPVSTLEAMAWSAGVRDGLVCCCMDARREQVYNAVFQVRDGVPTRLREDRAIALETLAADLETLSGPIRLAGDGALLVHGALGQRLPFLELAPEFLRQQRASGVALAAWAALQAGARPGSAADAAPNYLRLSQAERERLERDKDHEKGD